MRRRILIALAAAATLAGVAIVPATADVGVREGLYNSRYCEVFVLHGYPPDAKIVVWNTVGLNHCPAEKWESLDPGQLASERGATAVILNGPRHWVLDSAKGRIGREQSFDGLRARRVATIPITSASDLQRTPYTEREIDRHNVWHWNKGRRVYKLLAPDGSTYVMQAYSQIVDPDQQLGDLASLGDRLDLPPGWVFRVKRLQRPLDLKTKATARIIQDDLQNTYQRLPGQKRSTRDYPIAVTGTTKETGSPSPGVVRDEGTTAGSPFGRSSIKLDATFGSGNTMTATFKLHNGRGSIFGTATTTYVVSGNKITFDGSAELTGGTKKFRGIKGSNLKVHDTNTLDGQNGVLILTGTANF